jgi:hypothetical protein
LGTSFPCSAYKTITKQKGEHFLPEKLCALNVIAQKPDLNSNFARGLKINFHLL